MTDTAALITTPRPTLTYRLVSGLLVFPVFRGLFRGSTVGLGNVPMQGPLVVVANHGSHLDPPILGHALGRPVAFMAKAELFNIPLLGSVIRGCGAYPVRRGASDREAIRTATACLEGGSATGVFLDGTRQADGRVNHPLPGAASPAATNADADSSGFVGMLDNFFDISKRGSCLKTEIRSGVGKNYK